MASMKAVRIHDFGGPDVMRFEEISVPDPKPGEVLVRIYAASVNPVDYKTREGHYPVISRDKLPIVMGRDIAGVVERCGEGVKKLKTGDEVYALLSPDRGGFAEFVTMSAADVALKPTQLDFCEAAAVPLAALTAWQGLFDVGKLARGRRVLIHGGAGGVGHFAIQFAKTRDCEVFTTVAGKDVDFVRDLGADRAIDYKNERFEEIASDVDLVFDLIGGETRERSWAVLQPGGMLVSTLGQPSQDDAARHHVHAAGYMAQPNAAQLAEIAELIDSGRVRPFVAATFPWKEARSAEDHQQHGHNRGKIVLEVAAAA